MRWNARAHTIDRKPVTNRTTSLSQDIGGGEGFAKIACRGTRSSMTHAGARRRDANSDLRFAKGWTVVGELRETKCSEFVLVSIRFGAFMDK